MTCRAKFHIISLLIVPILILPDAGARSAEAPARLDAYYSATLLGLPIGHISSVVDLQGNRFNSVATGSISGFLRLFLDAQGSVAAEGHLSDGKPVASRFQLKILAGEASIAAGPRLILFAALHLSGFRIDQVHPRAGDARKRRQKGFSIGLSLDSWT